MKTYDVSLTTQELEALQKTIGIALDNLTTKINRHGEDSALGKSALFDRKMLMGVTTEIIHALSEAYNV